MRIIKSLTVDNRLISVQQVYRAQRKGRIYLAMAKKRRIKLMRVSRLYSRAKYTALFLLLADLVTWFYFLVIL